MHQPNQFQLLSERRFAPFFWTQALGACNDNIYKNAVTPICSYELSDSSKWYPLSLNKPGMKPWVVQDDGAPEEIRLDKSSDFYKTTLKVSLAYVLRGNGELALPQCMQSWAGTAP